MNRPVVITLWPNLYATTGERLELTWTEYIERLKREAPPGAPAEILADKGAMTQWKEHLPGWSPGTFTGERRARDTVERLSAIVLDLETVPIETARAEFARFAGWLHTSASHTDERPALRAVLLADRDVDAGEYDVVHAEIVATLPTQEARTAAEQAKDPSRFWYVSTGDAEWIELAGEPIDVDAILSAARTREAVEKRARDRGPPGCARSGQRDGGPPGRGPLGTVCARRS